VKWRTEKSHLMCRAFSREKENNGQKLAAKVVSFFRTVDKSSIDLFRAAANGETYKEAVVILERSPKEKVLLKLKQAFIDNYETNDGMTENFDIKFTTMVVVQKK